MKMSLATCNILISNSTACLKPNCLPTFGIISDGLGTTTHAQSAYQLIWKNPEEYHDILEAKKTFTKLAKEYHLDSQANKDARPAVRVLLEVERSGGKGDGQCVKLKPKGFQHLQYLKFEGIKTAHLSSQRYNHHQRFHIQRNMSNFRFSDDWKDTVEREAKRLVNLRSGGGAARRAQMTNTIERLVEDLVVNAMSKGDFENLPNKGKPLPDKLSECPFWDIDDYNLNRVLADNGYVPEWILAERDIKSESLDLKKDLLKARLKLGPEPLNPYNQKKWKHLQDKFVTSIQSLNEKVERRNLMVPLLRLQMVHLRPQREIDKVVKDYEEQEKTRKALAESTTIKTSNSQEDCGHIVGKILEKIFQKVL